MFKNHNRFRWLLLREREDEAKNIFMKICKSSNKVLDEKKWREVVESEKEKVLYIH